MEPLEIIKTYAKRRYGKLLSREIKNLACGNRYQFVNYKDNFIYHRFHHSSYRLPAKLSLGETILVLGNLAQAQAAFLNPLDDYSRKKVRGISVYRIKENRKSLSVKVDVSSWYTKKSFKYTLGGEQNAKVLKEKLKHFLEDAEKKFCREAYFLQYAEVASVRRTEEHNNWFWFTYDVSVSGSFRNLDALTKEGNTKKVIGVRKDGGNFSLSFQVVGEVENIYLL